MFDKHSTRTTFIVALLIILIGSCNSNSPHQDIPKRFQAFITEQTSPVNYLELFRSSTDKSLDRPDTLTSEQALEDIEMMQYLWTTSYSGYEYWMEKGVDFESHITGLKELARSTPRLSTREFENQAAAILQEILDGHLSIVGEGYHAAYRHKSVYFADILVELSGADLYRVISSKNEVVEEGAVFTQENPDPYLFRTLSAPGKEQFLLGNMALSHTNDLELSFDNKTLTVPLHKSRLLFSRFDDPQSYFITHTGDIPIVRITGFGDELYPQMQEFMQAGVELKNETTILINLFNNGGGSSVFPQTFLANLNGPVQWETYWGELTSPAISEYYSTLDLDHGASPALKGLKSRYASQFIQLKRFPMRSWRFSNTKKHNSPGSYKGQLILLTNRRVLSAGENLVGASGSIKNRVVIGENTGGVAQFSSTVPYVLPHSRLVLNLPRQLIFIPGLEECVGYLPDYWLDTSDPVQEVVSWLKDPGTYQFSYTQSFAELMKEMAMEIVLPEDIQITAPSSEMEPWQSRFAGKWFGVNDGILDHMLVVEKMQSSQDITGIYAWGVAYQWGISSPGWMRLQGHFSGRNLILNQEGSSIVITYTLNPDGSMTSVYERPGIVSRAQLTRK